MDVTPIHSKTMKERLWTDTPRVLFVTPDNTDITTIYRVFWPAMELAARGYIADYCTYGDLNQYEAPLRYGRYNTLVTPRMAFENSMAEKQWLAMIGSLRSMVHWWYDCDDDLWSSEFVERQMAQNKYPEKTRETLEVIRKSRIRLASYADGITVASKSLLNFVADTSLNGRVRLVPNGINERAYAFAAVNGKPRVVPPLTVGWSGGPRLDRDLEPLYDVWPKLAGLRPGINFVLQGWAPELLVSLIPSDRLHILPGVEAAQYPNILRNIDVFCCPSGDDPWVLNKTPIKWFEATLAGAACVVSDKLYGSVINPPHAAMVAHNPETWLRSLLALCDDLQLRRTIHAAAMQVVLSQHTLSQTYESWLDAWSNSMAAH